MPNLDKSVLNYDEAVDDNAILYEQTRTAMECICPKCGQKHVMNIHWIGRGVPRKFCKHCRSIAHDAI